MSSNSMLLFRFKDSSLALPGPPPDISDKSCFGVKTYSYPMRLPASLYFGFSKMLLASLDMPSGWVLLLYLFEGAKKSSLK